MKNPISTLPTVFPRQGTGLFLTGSLFAVVVLLAGSVNYAAGEKNTHPPDKKKEQAEKAWQMEQEQREKDLKAWQENLKARQEMEKEWARQSELRQKEIRQREEEIERRNKEDRDQIKQIVDRKRKVRERERDFRNKIEQLEAEQKAKKDLKRLKGENWRKKKEKLAEQIGTLQAALEKNPDDPESHWRLGVYHQELGRVDEAIGYYSKTLDLNPEHFGAYFNLALAYDKKKEGEGAVINMKKAEQLLLAKTRSWAKAQIKWLAKSRKHLRQFHKKYKLNPDDLNLEQWLSRFSGDVPWTVK